jgi:hypothetical protein
MPTEDRLEQREYLSLKELCERIPYDDRTIRNMMTKGKLILGTHYFKPNGRLIFKWSAIVQWIEGDKDG